MKMMTSRRIKVVGQSLMIIIKTIRMSTKMRTHDVDESGDEDEDLEEDVVGRDVKLDDHNKDKDEDEDDDLKEDVVGSRDVELCAVASPIALHVVDLHTVAIGALRD